MSDCTRQDLVQPDTVKLVPVTKKNLVLFLKDNHKITNIIWKVRTSSAYPLSVFRGAGWMEGVDPGVTTWRGDGGGNGNGHMEMERILLLKLIYTAHLHMIMYLHLICSNFSRITWFPMGKKKIIGHRLMVMAYLIYIIIVSHVCPSVRVT